MGILDKLKGKEKSEKDAKAENVLNMVKETPKEEKIERKLKEDTGRAHRILKSGHLSEKANMLSTLDRYVFKVDRRANKIEIAKAVEKTYDVKVVSVNVINNKGKTRRTGRSFGQTNDWKKAIVTLKQGQKIAGLTEGA